MFGPKRVSRRGPGRAHCHERRRTHDFRHGFRGGADGKASRKNVALVENAPAAAQAMQRRVPQDRHLERMAVPIDGVALKPAAQRPIQLGQQPDLRPARKES
jgi:hypothetical protein